MDGIQSIGGLAFNGFMNLQSVTIPSSVKSLQLKNTRFCTVDGYLIDVNGAPLAKVKLVTFVFAALKQQYKMVDTD